MSNILYTNYKGKPVTVHSYSGGNTFRYCKRRYKLERLEGWREKDLRAATKFGTAVETAIIFHVNNKLQGGVAEFERLWEPIKDIKGLVYSDKEGDWESLLRMGRHMLQLFSVWWPTMGFIDPKWQLQYKKEVFPGSPEYAGLEFTAYVDLRTTYTTKPLVIDVKTAGSPMTMKPAMLQLDPQLADYAWVTGIPDVAFLVLVKGGTSFDKGDAATILKTGETLLVCMVDSETKQALLLPQPLFAQYDREAKGVKGNALKDLKKHYSEFPEARWMPVADLTKCKIQFLLTTIPDELIREAGEIEAQNMVDIVDANRRNHWPQDGRGIRFPNTKCLTCPQRGICIKDDALRDEILVQLLATPPASEQKQLPLVVSDWLEELGE